MPCPEPPPRPPPAREPRRAPRAQSLDADEAAPDADEGRPVAPPASAEDGSDRESAPPLRLAGARLDTALVAASALGIAFLLVQIATYSYGRDQGIYAMVARTLLEGGAPYRDAWDFKPPGIFAVYALARALFGPAQIGVRLLECAGLVVMVAAMTRLASRFWGEWRIGLFAGAIAVLVHAQLDFWHTAQPESFGGMLTMLGLWAGTTPVASRRGEVYAWGGAGVLFGLAGLLKPPLAGGGAVLAIALAWPALREAWIVRSARAFAGALRPVGLVAIGGVLPSVVCAAWFAQRGALADLRQTIFVFAPEYTALSWQGQSLIGMLYWGLTEWLVTYSSVVTVGLLLLLGIRRAPNGGRGVALLAGVVAMQILGVVAQGKFFPYHYGATWPPTAMLVALGYWAVWQRARRHIGGAALFAAGFAAIALGRSACKDVPGSYLERTRERTAMLLSGRIDPARLDALASVADVSAAANRAVAAALRERVARDRSVSVWGFAPVIYDLSARRPASRSIYDVPPRVAWAKARTRAELMRDLAASPPAAIVVEHRDVFPHVTGDVLDSADTLPDFPELGRLLADRYRHALTVEDFDVFLEDAPADDGH